MILETLVLLLVVESLTRITHRKVQQCTGMSPAVHLLTELTQQTSGFKETQIAYGALLQHQLFEALKDEELIISKVQSCPLLIKRVTQDC